MFRVGPREEAKPKGFAKLSPAEYYWQERYNWLLESGYRLRARYHPDWVPSWYKDTKLYEGLTEDSERPPHHMLMDAIRVSDENYVILKRVSRQESPHEIDVLRYFSQEPQHSDPRNHTIDLLEVLQPPDDRQHSIIVLPVLRPYDSPDFDTVGEGLHFMRQILQGLCFLHEHRVAHRDIRSSNFLLDGKDLYAEQTQVWRPTQKADRTGKATQTQTRTGTWPKYHIIDFGFSKQYPPEEMPPSELPVFATDQTVPEFQNPDVPCNPFPIDVYTFGNLIRTDFIDGDPDDPANNGRKGFEFLRPLAEAMAEEEPEKRITMLEALERFDTLVSQQPTLKLRSFPARAGGDGVSLFHNPIEQARIRSTHWARKAKYLVKNTPPYPHPPSASSSTS